MTLTEMIAEIRANLNEAVESHWLDSEIIRKLNNSQREMAQKLASARGNWLLSYSSFGDVRSTEVENFYELPTRMLVPRVVKTAGCSTPLRQLDVAEIGSDAVGWCLFRAQTYGQGMIVQGVVPEGLWYDKGPTEMASLDTSPVEVSCTLPEDFHEWLVLRATVALMAKPSSSFKPEVFSHQSTVLTKATREIKLYISQMNNPSDHVRITGDY